MEGRKKYYPRSSPQCRVSDPANPHKLCRRYDPPLSTCFSCNGHHLERKRYYYYCATCDLEFHRGCHLFSREIKHSFHLLHPLTLFPSSSNSDLTISKVPVDWADSSSNSDTDFDVYEDEDENENDSILEGNHVKCKSCRRLAKDIYYHCSICNFSLHIICAILPPPLTIKNLKSHDHTLTLFPRRVPLPCDACGFSLDATLDHVYSCLLCNYLVHRKCIYLPRVIKITRHPHRLSHIFSVIVPSGRELISCGVCRKTVDVNYGQYSCNKGCHYALHSKCATRDDVWDGKDLEGLPEEEEQVIEPFVRIDEETIQHFSHEDHYLKFHNNRKDHENKFCQACTLWITVSDRLYSCLQCEFVLHEECASLPRKKHHPLHKHPLTLFPPLSSVPWELQSVKGIMKGVFLCKACYRFGCAFMYKCTEKDCCFQVDARCASLPDPSLHGCHPRDHPLFFNLTEGQCMGCKMNCSETYLECMECKSFLGIRCATLPCVAHYKHDKHPLTLHYGEEEATDLQYWCEICETKLEATKWFYTCISCCVTLHVACLLGKTDDVYMKPNHVIKFSGVYIDIARNSGSSRPVCDSCGRRCMYTLVFKCRGSTFCTFDCLPTEETY